MKTTTPRELPCSRTAQRLPRVVLFLIWPALFLFFACFPLPASAQQLGRSAARANYVQTRDLAAGAAVKWRFPTGGKVLASPVVAGELLLIGSDDGNLYALDKRTGQERWRFPAGGSITTTVAVAEGTGFFLSGSGVFYALDLASGRPKWTFQTTGEKAFDTWDYFLSSAAVHDGAVYFGSGDGHLYALDAATGHLKWKFRTEGMVHASPTVAYDAVFIGSYDGFFYAINLDGTLRWKFDTIGERYFPRGEVQYHAVAADSTVYFCSRDYNVYALQVRTGYGQWVYHEIGSWTSVPSLHGSKLLVTTSDSHHLISFGKEYGNVHWQADLALNAFGSATLTDSMAYVGSMDGRLHQIHLGSGQVLYSFQTEASRQHYAHFFDAATGSLRRDLMERYDNDFIRIYNDFFRLGSILSTPWIEDGVVYFGSADGTVYALE